MCLFALIDLLSTQSKQGRLSLNASGRSQKIKIEKANILEYFITCLLQNASVSYSTTKESSSKEIYLLLGIELRFLVLS